MFDIDLSQVEHHPAMNDIVNLLCTKTQNTDRGFFQAEVAYYFGQMASCMRTTICPKGQSEMPVNVYALALATSGYGKGHSVGIMEEEVVVGFRKRFTEETFKFIGDNNMYNMSCDRSARYGTDQVEELEKMEKESKSYGSFPFVFSEATPPAIKQLRNLLLLKGAGAICLQIDEIGSNLSTSMEALTLGLEFYDQGRVKPKLTKSTNENQRHEEIFGSTPMNMLLFGTPVKLFDSGATEDLFYSLLEIGYARRCIFGYGHRTETPDDVDPRELYFRLAEHADTTAVQQWSAHFADLADPANFGWRVDVEDEVGIKLLSYRLACEARAKKLPDHEEIKRIELEHRYSKAMKLAGAYAFIDQATEITMDNLLQAIKLIEESGEAFQGILNREKSYVKLAKFIVNAKEEVTHADINEKLPWYKTGVGFRNEQMALATAYGYKNNIIIKKRFMDTVELFSGESLQETSLDKIAVAYSDHWSYRYEPVEVPFTDLVDLVQEDGLHWTNHAFRDNHRAKDKLIPGFNMIVLDIDEGVSLELAQELMADYTFMTHTTKRHQAEGYGDRFRMMIPINYHLNLDREEYLEFMEQFLEWLPFPVGKESMEPEKAWTSFENAEVTINADKPLVDILPFIPRTSRNETYKQEYRKLESLDNLQRWFASRVAVGNRNKNLHSYAMALVDSGMSYEEVRTQVHAFNAMLSNSISKDEIDNTIMITVGKSYAGQ